MFQSCSGDNLDCLCIYGHWPIQEVEYRLTVWTCTRMSNKGKDGESEKMDEMRCDWGFIVAFFVREWIIEGMIRWVIVTLSVMC